jgi:hypothetical protein
MAERRTQGTPERQGKPDSSIKLEAMPLLRLRLNSTSYKKLEAILDIKFPELTKEKV